MSAPQICLFLPTGCNGEEVFDQLVEDLGLTPDELPAGRAFSFQSSAQSGRGNAYILVERYVDSTELINELTHWERPSTTLKALLAGCTECISVTYRDLEKARALFKSVDGQLGSMAPMCVVENGEGCLLTLHDIQRAVASDQHWRWDRRSFPEFPRISDSEWDQP